MIYFDNAATSFPKPKSVRQAVNRALAVYGANPGRSGHSLAVQTSQQVFLCRQRAADLFHCQPEQVVFTKNCTEAINLAIKGVMLSGGHMILSDLEHNSVARVAAKLNADYGVDCDVAQVCPQDEDTVRSFQRLIRPDTRLIACTQGSNVFGMRVPVEQIGEMAHRHGIPLLVDAAQTAGVLDIDLSRDPIDFLCVAGHKGLYGPPGTGLLVVNCDLPLDTILEGGTGSASLELTMPDFLPDRLESGTVNTAGILGLRAGIDFVLRKTPKALYRHEMDLAAEIYRRLSQVRGVTLYSPKPKMYRTLPVLSLTIGGLDGMDTAQELSRLGVGVRGGFHCACLAHRKMGTGQRGTARISVGCYNTLEEVRYLHQAVARIAARQPRA